MNDAPDFAGTHIEPRAQALREALRCQFADYLERHPGEAGTVDLFQRCLRRGAAAFRRDGGGDGHFTASALLLSRDGQQVLLTHHRKLDRWLQPGGHADGDPDLLAVALREASEESGLAGLLARPGILDLDRHEIPARLGEAAHFHYDVRFVVQATCAGHFVVSAESHALAWRNLADVIADGSLDGSLRRMARKWRACPPG